MKKIPLTRGQIALVDDEDYERLAKWKWYAAPSSSGCWYARRRDKSRKIVHMHQFLLTGKLGPGLKPDHKDGNGLNNQKSNLRPATQLQNSHNQKLCSDSASGYKGVSWSASKNKWQATIRINKRSTYIGRFKRKVDAAVAYDTAAQIHFGEFARLNFYYDPACFI